MRDLEALRDALLRVASTDAVTLLVAPAHRLDGYARMAVELVRSALGEGDSRFRLQHVCSPRTPDRATEDAFLQLIEARAFELSLPVEVRARIPGEMKHFTEWLALQGPAPKRPYRIETVERWYTDDGRLHERANAFSVDASSGNEAAYLVRQARAVIDAPCVRDATIHLLDLGTHAWMQPAPTSWPADDPALQAQDSAIRQATLADASLATLMQLAEINVPLDGMVALSEAWQVSIDEVEFVGAYLRGEVTAHEADAALLPVRTRIADSLRLAVQIEEALATGTLTRETRALAERRTIDSIRWLRHLMRVGLAEAKSIVGTLASMGDEALLPGAFGRVAADERDRAQARRAPGG